MLLTSLYNPAVASKSRSRALKGASPTGANLPASAPKSVPAVRSPLLPLAFICGLAAFMLLPRIQNTRALLESFGATTAVLLGLWTVLWSRARNGSHPFRMDVSLRAQHYLQAAAHTSIFVYWGFYWMPIKDAFALLAAQIVFAYAFDMLLSWTSGKVYTLGFGAFPVIYSTNLFLRFHDDWFALQFLMIAVGFVAKAFIRWEKDGRRTHIFNPSSFTLALFSLVLIATRSTDITWGEGIATQLIMPPQIYLFIFLVSLPGQFLFRVTSMTLPAVLTTYGFSMLYLKLTGTYFFFDSNVPIAVFLGMHLLFTDPSTSPRSELGRIIFGVIYGLSVVGLYVVLGWIGAPRFYDKLLQVPLMNLSIRWIDRFADSRAIAWLSPARIGARLPLPRRSLAYVSLWILVFGAMSLSNGLGDNHPGHTVTFWEKACREGRPTGCEKLGVVESRHCDAGSPWACNELGILAATQPQISRPANASFTQACASGLPQACRNGQTLASGLRTFIHTDPTARDYQIVLRTGKGPLPSMPPLEIYTRACNLGWMAGCNELARFYFTGDGVLPDKARAIGLLERACSGGHALACGNVARMYERGDGAPRDDTKAQGYLRRACDLGESTACRK